MVSNRASQYDRIPVAFGREYEDKSLNSEDNLSSSSLEEEPQEGPVSTEEGFVGMMNDGTREYSDSSLAKAENTDIAQEKSSIRETELFEILHQRQIKRTIQATFLKSDLTGLLQPSSSSSDTSKHNSADLETILLAPIQRHQCLAMSSLTTLVSKLLQRTRNMLQIGIDRQPETGAHLIPDTKR